ncbi:DUF6642 family protein [Flavobacterium sp. C4GT6]|uniref:DUF6642 family protein n=1 Tax=Flavobacterium sp. C4GT6 TaxID=3103818 RepID=UPI002ED3527D
MDYENFIFCLEAVADVDRAGNTEVVRNLEQLAFEGISSIYKNCDTIEGMEESLQALLYDDHNFKNYEIIYLVMQGQANNICLNGYYYSIEEIAELFEGRMKGKVIHFANSKVLDLDEEEAQYFLDITGAKAISGYGLSFIDISSVNLDKLFFSLFEDSDDVVDIVEELHEKRYTLCKRLDFRLYY